MTTIQPEYFTAYSSLKMARDAQGVLVVKFHSTGGPLTFTARDHTQFVDAFYRIGQDRANTIVIFTGRRAFHRRYRLLIIRECRRSGGVEPGAR